MTQDLRAPWRIAVDVCEGAEWWGHAPPECVVVDVDGKPVCATNDDGVATQREIELARFIVSAPMLAADLARERAVKAELLAAAKEIERWWVEDEMKNHSGAPAGMFMIRAAIARAEASQ